MEFKYGVLGSGSSIFPYWGVFFFRGVLKFLQQNDTRLRVLVRPGHRLGSGTQPFSPVLRQWKGKKKGKRNHSLLGGGFKYFLFSPLFGEDSHFD